MPSCWEELSMSLVVVERAELWKDEGERRKKILGLWAKEKLKKGRLLLATPAHEHPSPPAGSCLGISISMAWLTSPWTQGSMACMGHSHASLLHGRKEGRKGGEGELCVREELSISKSTALFPWEEEED